MVADDFYANFDGPIPEIHIWGSWANDQFDPHARFRLRIYTDVAATNSQPSHPRDNVVGKNLSAASSLSVSASVSNYLGRGPWRLQTSANHLGSVPAGGRGRRHQGQQALYYRFYMHDEQPVCPDQRSNLLALGDAAGTTNQFGWKTAITNDHYLDDAVFATQTNAASGWVNLHYPTNHPFAGQSMDMAFALTAH